MSGIPVELIPDPPAFWPAAIVFVLSLAVVVALRIATVFSKRPQHSDWPDNVTLASGLLVIISAIVLLVCVRQVTSISDERNLRAVNEHYGLELSDLPRRGHAEIVEHDGKKLVVEHGKRRLSVYEVGPEHRP